MTVKICNYCEVAKPATSEFFGKRKQSKDGLAYGCRDCMKDRWKAEKSGEAWLSAKSIRLAKAKANGTRKCHQCGEDKPIEEYSKNGGKAHKNETTRAICKLCHNLNMREQRKSNKETNIEYHSIRENLNGARKRAKENGYPFDIVIEDLMPFPTHCAVFGTELNYGQNDKMNGASLDKVIPSLGYVKGNVKIISNRANAIKGNSTEEELETMLEYIKNNR